MPKKTKKGKGILNKLRGRRPSVSASARASARGSARGSARASARTTKPRAIPRKSKKTTNYTEFVSRILDPKKNCNLFLVKYKATGGGGSKSGASGIVNNYELYENKTKITDIHQEKRKHLEKIYSEEGNILCKGIGKDFINQAYLESDISILQFSRTRTTKRITKRVTKQVPEFSKRPFSLCGIICLKNLVDTAEHANIYLDLICSRPGFGSNLLKIAENCAKTIGKTRLFLKSVDSPLPFYVYKDYTFITGQDIVDLSKEPSFSRFFADPKNILKNKGRSMYEFGITIKYSNRISSKRKLSNINILNGVKGDIDDGIAMYKDLV